MYIFTYNLQKSGKRFPRKICHCYSYCLHVEKHPPKDVASNNKFAYSSVTGHNSILEVRIRKKNSAFRFTQTCENLARRKIGIMSFSGN